jgi:hypothetical protein
MDKISRHIGFYVAIDNDGLTISPDDTFVGDVDMALWGKMVCESYPQTFQTLTIDLGKCKKFISSFISQIILLRDFYLRLNPELRIRLINTTKKMRDILHVMAVDKLFDFF